MNFALQKLELKMKNHLNHEMNPIHAMLNLIQISQMIHVMKRNFVLQKLEINQIGMN